jgi:signal transduction histidine kinase
MKKKIVVALTIFSLLFCLLGVYIIVTIEKATSTLDTLIKLHQVEILRESLLIRIKRVQTDLSLKNTRYARGIYTVVGDVRSMGKISNECFRCHHSEFIVNKLTDMRDQIEKYKDAISRVLTIKANIDRLEAEEDNAINIGEELVTKVSDMIEITSKKLEEKTTARLKDIREIKIILFTLIAMSPLVVIFLGYLFIRAFAKPITTLLNATRSLKGGNLDYRIEGLTDEFGEVADSFNDMAYSLREQMRNMQRAEQMTVVGEMAASLAHELKNLLTGLKIALQVLLENKSLSDSETEIAKTTFSQIKRVEFLIKDVLDFARPKEPEYKITDLNELIDKTVAFIEAFSSQTNNKGAIKVEKSLSPDIPDILVDPMQMQQVIMNLVLNSCDAMPDGGTLKIGTALVDSSVSITVSDTGSGITPRDLDRIFKPFFTTKAKGTGLGLAISKGIVDRHAGHLTIDSNAGEGAIATVTLPLTHGAPDQNNTRDNDRNGAAKLIETARSD